MKLLNKLKCKFGKHETFPLWPRAHDQFRECIHCGKVQKMVAIAGCKAKNGQSSQVRIHWEDVDSI